METPVQRYGTIGKEREDLKKKKIYIEVKKKERLKERDFKGKGKLQSR